MADHYRAALGHRHDAQEGRDRLAALHNADQGGSEIRRKIGATYDQVRHSLKLAEIDALLAIGQGLRDLVSRLDAGVRP